MDGDNRQQEDDERRRAEAEQAYIDYYSGRDRDALHYGTGHAHNYDMRNYSDAPRANQPIKWRPTK